MRQVPGGGREMEASSARWLKAGCVLVVLGLVLAWPVRASAEPMTYRLSLVRAAGAESCPTASEVEARVNARLKRAAFSATAGPSIEGAFSREGAGWVAELWVRDEAGRPSGSRRIPADGADCAALAEAATLAIALTIDPDAALADPPASQPAPEQVLAEPPPRVPPCPLCPAAPLVRCPACTTPTRSGAELSVRASARVLAVTGALPGVVPGLGLQAEAGSQRWAGFAGVSYLPEARTSDRRFGFGLTAASAGACGSFRIAEPVLLGACGGLELGAVHGVVYALTPLEPGDRLWFAVAVGPRLRVSGPGPVFFDFGLMGVAPLLQRTFSVRGVAEPAFEQRVFGGLGYLGVGIGAP